MNFEVGDMVIAKAKRRMMRHVGTIVEMHQEDNEDVMIITNGREKVRIRLFDWEVKRYENN